MQIAPLGQTGLRVSRLCLGTMMFGAIGNADHDDCIRIIHHAFDAGVNFLDTADVYSLGESERIVGKSLRGRREAVVLATKFVMPMGPGCNEQGGSRTWITRAVENSLRRLDTEYIDLYQIHRYDEATDLEEVLFTLTELVRQGKIRYFGSSMFPADRIVEAQWVAERRGLMRFRCEQPWYSIFARDIERFVLPACHRYGMGAIVWSPLDGGFLSGKYQGKSDLTRDTRVVKHAERFMGGFDPEAEVYRRKLELIPRLAAIAAEAGMTLPQLAIAFVLRHPFVTSAIIGPRLMPHLDGLLSAADLSLDEAILNRIDALVPPGSSINPLRDQPDGTQANRRAVLGARLA